MNTIQLVAAEKGIPEVTKNKIIELSNNHIVDSIVSNEFFIGIITLTLMIGVVSKTIKYIIIFYEENIILRRIKRLNFLEVDNNDSSVTKEYLDFLKSNEIFQISSGILESPEKNKELMKFYLQGFVNISELKKIYKYLDFSSPKVLIKTSLKNKINFIYSFSMGLVLFLAGALYSIIFFIIGGSSYLIPGIAIQVSFTIMAFIMSKDFRSYCILARIKKKLKARNKLGNPEESIMFENIFIKNKNNT